jgi:hypothetical protein
MTTRVAGQSSGFWSEFDVKRAFIPHDRQRFWLPLVAQVGFFAAIILPRFERETIGTGPFAIVWWPSLCLFAFLVLCAATDYSSRRLSVRVSIVVIAMLAYWGIAYPFTWSIYRLILFGNDVAIQSQKGFLSTTFFFFPATRASWLFAKPANK